jgi:hypothetical protein
MRISTPLNPPCKEGSWLPSQREGLGEGEIHKQSRGAAPLLSLSPSPQLPYSLLPTPLPPTPYSLLLTPYFPHQRFIC